MKNFYGKNSWDGFLYQHQIAGLLTAENRITPIPIEIKSLKINTKKDKFDDLNSLLKARFEEKFTNEFKIPKSISCITVFPNIGNSDTNITPFRLDEAIDVLNKHVSPESIPCIVFIDIAYPDNKSMDIGLRCTFIDRYLNLSQPYSHQKVGLYEMPLTKIQFKAQQVD